MDIFTTQIAQATKTVSAPIRPEKLKVKALVKDARLGKLKKDTRELDENDYAFYHLGDKREEDESTAHLAEQEVVEISAQGIKLEEQEHQDNANNTFINSTSNSTKKTSATTEKKAKKSAHLDIFI